MTTPAADALERIARDVHALAFDFAEPARSRAEAEGRIARVEDLAAELRAVVRGRGGPGRVPDHPLALGPSRPGAYAGGKGATHF